MLRDRRNYADAFCLQWNTFRKTQLDSYCGTNISLRRARRCIGPEAWAFLQDHPGSEVLEAGSRAGRVTEILLRNRARVTSLGLETAAQGDQGNLPHNDQHRRGEAEVLPLSVAPHAYQTGLWLPLI